MKLIDKDDLIAEIEKRKHRNLLNEGAFEEDIDILSLIKTLEVKEVGLDEEIKSYFKGFGKYPSVGIDDCIDIAKHFFELGIKQAQKGE